MNKLITNVSVAGIFSSPNFKSEMIPQGLMFDPLIIKDKTKNWFFIKMEDGYGPITVKSYVDFSVVFSGHKAHILYFNLITTQ